MTRIIVSLIFLGILLFADCWHKTALAQISLLPADSLRHRIDLNGDWQCKILGESTWQSVWVPSLLQVQGSLFFRRTFELPPEAQDAQFLLVFEGVNFSCKVQVNGQYLATQTHGFTPVVIPVPASLLRFQQSNQIGIEINTALSKASVPASQSLFAPEPLRGIFRDVYLQVLPPVAVTSVQNQTHFSTDFSRATVLNRIQIQADDSFLQSAATVPVFTLTLNLWESTSANQVVLSVQKTVTSTELIAGTVDLSCEIYQPRLWQLDSPYQYRLQIILSNDQQILDIYTQNLGLRQIQLRSQKLFVNGAPVTLRGVTLIEDQHHWFTVDHSLAQLAIIRDLGFNGVAWFSPPSERALALSDSLGLLSILRVPIWNLPAPLFAQPAFRENAVSLTKRLAALAENHPSVVAISLGNGYDAGQSRSYEMVKLLRKQVAANSDFLVTAGFRNYPAIVPNLPLDFLTVDLTSQASADWVAWVGRWSVANPELPVLCAGVAVPFVPTQPDSENLPLFESDQARLLKQSIKTILENPTLGFVLASYTDWYGAYPTLLTPLQPQARIFPLGITDEVGTPRMAWNMIENLNSNQPDQFLFEELHLPKQKDNIFLFAGLIVMVFFLFFFRKDHHLRGNFIRVLIRPFGFYSELKEGRKISRFITTIIILTVAFTWALILESLFYYLRRNPLFDFSLAQLSFLPSLNFFLIQITWQPIWGLLGFGLIACVLYFLISVYIYLMAILFGRSLSLRNAATFVVWESSIFIFLLPVAFVFYRMLFIVPLRLPLLILLIIFCLWFLYRLFKGMETIFAFHHGLSLLLFLGVPLLLLLLVVMIYNHNRALNAHLEYLYHIWKVGL